MVDVYSGKVGGKYYSVHAGILSCAMLRGRRKPFDSWYSLYIYNFNKKNELVKLNGAIANLLNVRGLYSDMGMYVYDID